MSAQTDQDLDEAQGVEAAEYALGLLDEPERGQAERRLLSQPEFAHAVAGWEAHFAVLAQEARAEPPPAGAWTGIERRLSGDGKVVELRLRRRLRFWRGATAGAGVMAASLAVAMVWQRSPPVRSIAPSPLLSARLTSPAGSTLFVATLDPRGREIVLTPAAVAVTSGRSPELWLIPAGGKPVALGVAAFRRAVRLSPAAPLNGGGAALTLAISIEPEGGSTTGQPTGPVVATGRTEAL